MMKRRVSAPGCDDAPVIEIERGEEPHPLTLIYPYYENPNTLFDRIAGLNDLPADLTDHLSLTVVDDGSPDHPAEDVLRGRTAKFPIKLYRIQIDVRWNWLAARNIGMFHAKLGWCLMTDIDHQVDQRALTNAIYGKLDMGTIYRFSRREHTGEAIHPHPNSWLIHKSMFWQVGGYDEALSGHYGTDGEFRRRCAATAPIRILTDELVRWEHVGDSSTTKYLRKQPEDRVVQALVRARGPNWRPKVLSFPYHMVMV